MVYTQADIQAMKDHFLNPLSVGLTVMSEDELKIEFRGRLKGLASYTHDLTDYTTRRDTYQTDLNTLYTSGVLNSKKEREDRGMIDYYQGLLKTLESDTDNLAQSTAKWATELIKVNEDLDDLGVFGGLASLVDVDTTKNAAFNEASSKRRKDLSGLKEDITTTDYSNNDEVMKYIGQINTVFGGHIPSFRELNDSLPKIKHNLEKLKKKYADYLSTTGTAVDRDFAAYETAHKTAETEFDNAYKEIKSYAKDPAGLDINQSLQNVFGKFGAALLSDQHTGADADEDYQKVLSAYVFEEFGNTDYIYNEALGFEADFINAKADGDLDGKKKATDGLKSLKTAVDQTKARASIKMKRDLKKWERYVALNSALDYSSPPEFKFYTFNSKNGALAEDHAVDTYASGGLGFFRNLMEDTYISWLTNGIYTGIKDLKDKVVKKHKRASQRFFGAPPKESKIGVEEILIWGMYNAITESHKNNADILAEIITNWNAVTWLDNTATLRDIQMTYNSAAKLCMELDADAKQWTTRKKAGYVKIDNRVNEAAGWVYAWVDKARDYASRRLPVFAKREEDYDVDAISAIEPQWRPEIQFLLGAAGIIGATKITYDAIMSIARDKSKSASDKMAEVVKEIGIAAGVTWAIGEGRKTGSSA